MEKLDYIDALRGIAILGVMMVHSNQFGNSNLPITVNNIIGEGAREVQLFYLASAFTLFLSFHNRQTKENFPIRNFYLRRFFRIAPMYYLGIVYYLFHVGFDPTPWHGNETHITTLNVLSNFTFLHGFSPYWINSLVPGGWSIAVEMAFYVVLPVIFSKIKNINHSFNFFLGSLLLNLFLKLIFMKFHLISDEKLWGEFLFYYFPSQLPVFSLGIILYFLIIKNEGLRNVSGKSILAFSGLLLVQLGIGIQFILPNHVLFSIAFLALAYSLSRYKSIFFINPVIIYIGKISFSMYLVHFAVLYWLTHFNFVNYFENGLFNYATRFCLVTFLTVLIASVFFRIIELPFQAIGKKIINRLEANVTI